MSYKNRGGNMLSNIMIVVLIVAIGALIYVHINNRASHIGKTGGVDVADSIAEKSDHINVLDANGEFDDGLGRPNDTIEFELPPDMDGIVKSETFNRDINNDSQTDMIVRNTFRNGTAHFYYEYKIELNNNGTYTDITPDDFRTIEGADCALQKLHFSFSPTLSVVRISRPWQESWTTPTVATRTDFTMRDGKLRAGTPRELTSVCDVVELF